MSFRRKSLMFNRKEYAKNYYQIHKEYFRLYHQEYYQQNKEKIRKKVKQYRTANKAKANHTHWKGLIKRLYGVSADDYSRLFEEQHGCCAICGKHQSKLKKRLGVDHNHKTKEVRGLLCANCNAGIGYFQDSTDLLSKTIKYLCPFNKGE